MKRILAAALTGIFIVTSAQAAQTVVLLHGLARSSGSMSRLDDSLKAAGYATCNIGYPSTKYPIEILAREYVLPRVHECIASRPGAVSFVTHSMGGILVREIRRMDPAMAIGRVVMLGPPNHGSELVDHMRTWALFRWVNGPAGLQLGTGPDSVPNTLGRADFDVGIIAGNKPFLEPFKRYIRIPSDGKVSVESAKLDGMKDYIVLPVTHSLMMRDKVVIEQTVAFLQRGKFAGAVASDSSPEAQRP